MQVCMHNPVNAGLFGNHLYLLPTSAGKLKMLLLKYFVCKSENKPEHIDFEKTSGYK